MRGRVASFETLAIGKVGRKRNESCCVGLYSQGSEHGSIPAQYVLHPGWGVAFFGTRSVGGLTLLIRVCLFVTKRRSGSACVVNQKLEQETIKGTHAQERQPCWSALAALVAGGVV